MAEKRVIELEIQTNEKSLKAQLREAQADVQKLSEKFGATSDAAIQAAKRAAELKDAIGDAKDLTDAFNPDAKFNSLSRSVGGVLDGFQAFEGALGLVGVEAEAVQETMLKVQSVMALSQGLQGLMEARDSFKQLGAVAANALKGIKSGIAATGIGLLLVALGTIVAYWDDIKAAVNGVTAEQEKLNETYEKNAIVSKEIYESLQLQENSLRLQGKTEKEILQLRIQKINAAIKDEEVRIKGLEETSKMEVAAQERNMKWLKLYVRAVLEGMALAIRALAIPIDKVIETANFVSKALGNGELVATNLNEYISKGLEKASEWTAKLLFDPEEVKAESEKTINEAKKGLKQMQSDRDGFLLSLKENNQKEREDNKLTSDNTIKDKQDEIDAKLAAEKEYNEKLRAYYDAIEQERQGQITDAKEKELQELDNKFEALYKIADDANQSDKDLLLKHQQEIADINLKYKLLEQEEAKKNAEELAKIEKEKLDKIAEAEKLAAEKAKQAQQERVDLILKYAQTFGQAMGSLNSLLNVQDENRLKNVKKGSKEEEAIKRKMFDRDKKLRIVQTIIDTASNVVQSVRNGGGIPTGIPFGVAAGAMGALQIAAISKTKFDGGGGEQPPSPNAGGGMVQSPNFSIIGSSGVNQLAQLQQQPVQAYVVSGEVTSQQALDRNRLQNATL